LQLMRRQIERAAEVGYHQPSLSRRRCYAPDSNLLCEASGTSR